MNRSRFASIFGLMILMAACSDSASPQTTIAVDQHAVEFSFGEPAAPSAANRVVEITTAETFQFEPAEISVTLGETMTFRITNAGEVADHFTIGDQTAQDEHGAAMADTAGMPGMVMVDEPNAVVLGPGETKEVTWKFTVAGIVFIGCHQPGHYDAGMGGTITVGDWTRILTG